MADVRHDVARRFVDAMNAFDVPAVAAMLASDFEFSIGSHTADRGDFLASLATGPESDPAFAFETDSFDVDGEATVLVRGRQEYRWRETGELAASAERLLALELAGGRVRRARVDDGGTPASPQV